MIEQLIKKEINDCLYSDTFYVTTASSIMKDYLERTIRVPSANLLTSITKAHTQAKVNNGINNVVFLSPDSHSQAAALTWSANMTHLVGLFPPSRMNQRSRIGHSANFDALLTVSGGGNMFKNLYFMHGRGSATNLHAVEVTGDRNVFHNCHIAGPFHATEAGTAGYSCLELTGAEECHFENCVIGADTIARSAANSVLRIGVGATRNTFENCTFLMMSSAATPYFIEVASGNTFGMTRFKNCSFINYSSNWATSLTIGCNIACGATQHRLIFENDCTFFGVTDVAAAAKEGSAMFGTVVAVNTSVTGSTGNGLNLTANHT